MNIIEEYAQIQRTINKLTALKKPVNPKMQKRQIEILQQLDDELLNSKQENINIYIVRIRYNAMMKTFSEKLGLPIEKYVNNINLLTRKLGIPNES